jgi:hypothetical protein
MKKRVNNRFWFKDILKTYKSKKSQEIFGMSFGMIFSIILIVFFVIVAIIAIKAFLDVQKCAKVGLFLSNFQDEIDSAWNANDITLEFKGNLPSGIKQICFSNTTNAFSGPDKELGIELDIYPDKNMFLLPSNKACDMSENNILHLDINSITRTNNPYCIDVKNGKFTMIIENENNGLVKIRK